MITDVILSLSGTARSLHEGPVNPVGQSQVPSMQTPPFKHIESSQASFVQEGRLASNMKDAITRNDGIVFIDF